MANQKINIPKLSLRIGWLFVMALALLLFITTAFYFSFRTDINFLLAKQAFVRDWAWMSSFYLHISGSMICLVLGPLQFIPSFRRKFLKGHRSLGNVYVGAILFVGGPSGLYMSFFANGGWGAQLGFLILSLLWWLSTYKAYQTVRQGNIRQHRAWMLRSYALTFSAVTLRLWVPILSLGFSMDHALVVVLTAWINWIPNLLIAEWILRKYPQAL